jgi:cobalt/nickel transport protein
MSSPTTKSSSRSVWVMAVVLLAIAAAIAVGSLLYGYSQDAEAEFGGADGQAEEVIVGIDESYEPWYDALVGELPGEVESGLFALQAGLGGIVLGGAIGWYAGRHRGRTEALPAADKGAPDGA